MKLHVTAHVAQMVRLSTAHRTSPDKLVGLLFAVLDDQVGDLLVEIHDGVVSGGHRCQLS